VSELRVGDLLLRDNCDIGVVCGDTTYHYKIYWVWNYNLEDKPTVGFVHVPKSMLTPRFMYYVEVIRT
jgi:hypothetical protein